MVKSRSNTDEKLWWIRWNLKIGRNVETTKYLEINGTLEMIPRGGEIIIKRYWGALKTYFWIETYGSFAMGYPRIYTRNFNPGWGRKTLHSHQ